MGVSKVSAALRIALGAGLVGLAVAAGVLQRSPWILPFMAAGFVAAYRFGQLRTWRAARAGGSLRQYWLSLPADFLVQLILTGVLYLVGFGLSALTTGGVRTAEFGPGDAIWPLAFGAVGSLMGLYIDRLEGKPAHLMPDWLGAPEPEVPGEPGPGVKVQPDPLTPHSFFSQGPDAGDREAGLSEDDITRAEARLGRALPDLLIALYRVQNGGGVGALCVVKPGTADASTYDDILTPFGGYDDLIPAQNLRTVWETVTDYADPDDPGQADQFPEGSKAMIVLAQWYRETLFLDYNQPGAPRVGFCDFDRFDTSGKREPVIWWPDFETFFAGLRRYELV